METLLNLNDHFVAQFRELEVECERLRHQPAAEATTTRPVEEEAETRELRQALVDAERQAAEMKQALTQAQARLEAAEQQCARWREELSQEQLEQQRVRGELQAAGDRLAALEEANGQLKRDLETRSAAPPSPPPLPAANAAADRRPLLVRLEELREENRDLKSQKMRLERELYQLKHA